MIKPHSLREVKDKIEELGLHKKRETTSLKIEPKLWKKAKHAAINHNIDLSDLVEEAITLWLEVKDK